jgi:uncharacterized protein YegL
MFCFVGCPVDLVLLVDSSGSIRDQGENNWDDMMSFLKKIFDRIDTSQLRAAVVDFSNLANIYINFDSGFQTPTEYQRAIDDTIAKSYQGGDTNTALGLRRVRDDVLGSSGNRNAVRDVVIVLTDGHPTLEVDALPDEARRVRDYPALVVAIGVTNNVNRARLEQIASGSNNVFQVEQFDQLLGEVDTILSEACLQPTPAPTMAPTASPTCKYSLLHSYYT